MRQGATNVPKRFKGELCYSPGMAVSQQDRDLMRRLGEYKRGSHHEAAAQHGALPLDQRLQRSWELYLSGRESARRRDDDPSPFYERARARGLYRP